MGIEAPKIDKRSFEELLKEFRALVPFYTAEWNPSEKDVGLALVKIFHYMLEIVIQRFNQVPEKNFIAFLDKIGTQLLPAQPAIAPVTFSLSEGAEEHVLILERTQIGTGDIIFETEKNILATPARLIKAYSVSTGEDGIYESPTNVVSGEPVVPFRTTLLYAANTGEQEGFLSSTEGVSKGDMLLIGHSEYAIVSEVSDSKIKFLHTLTNTHNANSPVEKVTTFDLFQGKNLQEHILYLGHEDLFNLKPPKGKASQVKLNIQLSQGAEEQLELEWSYWGEDEKWMSIKSPLDTTSGFTKNGDITLTIGGEIKETEIREIKNRWLRCRLKKPINPHTKLPTINTIKVLIENTVTPDITFHNDVPLDLTTSDSQFRTPIYPFGKTPRLYDTFYIGSQEAFSKKDLNIEIIFDLSQCGQPGTDGITLSWEYWDGKGWNVIENLTDKTINFTESGKNVKFTCPEDIKPTQVNGQESYWIRVRIISGNYGKETFNSWWEENPNGNWVQRGELDTSQVIAPEIRCLTIRYALLETDLQYCLSYNNLELKKLTEESKTKNKTFQPFIPLDDEHQTVYLGVDKKLEKGPVSLFFSIDEYPWSGKKTPRIDWEYYAGNGQWTRLDAVDETRGLTRSGVINFVFPPNFSKTQKFGKELYWIRAIDVNGSFKIIKWILLVGQIIALVASIPIPHILLSVVSDTNSSEEQKGNPCDDLTSELSSCPDLLKTFRPEWYLSEEDKQQAIDPRIKGIYLNTTWAVQAETISAEILGSSDGTAGQRFTLLRTPVISAEVWVNEIRTTSEQERRLILENKEYEVRETQDEQGNVMKFWVKWKPVEDMLSSSKEDRHYELDRVSGEVIFGDGVYGKIPEIGTDNIRANYQTGGGSQGNLPAYEVKDLRTSIPFVDEAWNPLAAGGGADIEPIKRALERGPQILKHRNRAITAEDFEQITYKASRAVARAKCLPNWDSQGHRKSGWVTVLVIPQSHEDKPKLSLQLKRNVEDYLRAHAANTVVEKHRLQISEPVYVETSVNTALVADSTEVIPEVEKNTLARLQAFLHPLTGGELGQGWEFGKLPCFSDFYALLEKIEGVDHVKSLALRLRTYSEEKILSEFVVAPERRVAMKMPPYAIVYSGVHNITVRI